MHSGLFTGTKGDKEYKKQERLTMTEIIAEMNFFGHRIEKLNENKAETLKQPVDALLETQYCFEELKKFYDADEEYKEVVDTARFEQARLIEQTRNKLLEVYKKKVNALAKELAGVQ